MASPIAKLGTLVLSEQTIIIEGIDVTTDSISIRLNTPNGPFVGVCDADCCSETWIEDIEEPTLGFPCTVLEVYNLDVPDNRESEPDEPQELISFYGLKFVTDKGDIIIEYRNASNGYYGGSMEWSSKYFYGGVYGQCHPNGDWVTLEEWKKYKDGSLLEEN